MTTGFMMMREDKQRKDFEEGKLVLVLSCSVQSGSLFKDLNILHLNILQISILRSSVHGNQVWA